MPARGIDKGIILSYSLIMNMKMLLQECKEAEVLTYLFKHYPDQEKNITGYISATQELLETEPSKSPLTICVRSSVFDGETYLDIYATSTEEEGLLAIDLAPWDIILGSKVGVDTFQSLKLKKEEFLALALYEITYHGYSSKDCQEIASTLAQLAEKTLSEDKVLTDNQ